MANSFNLKKRSFLIYGLGSTGLSVIKYFKKNRIHNYSVWDDDKNLRTKYALKKNSKLKDLLRKVDYIVLSPGISLKNTKNKRILIKYKKKIITDIDLLYITNKKFTSIVVTGTNGKSTTCEIIYHLLKKNKFKVGLGGNIGTPILDIKFSNNHFLIIEASSYQLSHSKFIKPDYALILNITNDHLDWHGSFESYVQSKFKIFNLQRKKNFAILNKKLIGIFKKKKYSSKLISPSINHFKKIKLKITNEYLRSQANDENMKFVFTLARLLKINQKTFIKSMNSFVGLQHRFEIFLKKRNITFINDSKATSFQATKSALSSKKNIYWILGGLPKQRDKIDLRGIKKNIIRSYIIGSKINFFKKQLKNKIKFTVSKNIKNALIKILKDVNYSKNIKNTILFSPGAASFDQFKNFEERGKEFKRLCRRYA